MLTTWLGVPLHLGLVQQPLACWLTLITISTPALLSSFRHGETALCHNHRLLAVAQDQCVEISSAKDYFEPVSGKYQSTKRALTTLGKWMAWSHNCMLVACAEIGGWVRELVSPWLFHPQQAFQEICVLLLLHWSFCSTKMVCNDQLSCLSLVIMVNWKLTLYWSNPKLAIKLEFQFEQPLWPWSNYCGLWFCSWLWSKWWSQSNWSKVICMESSFRIFVHRQVTSYEHVRTAQRIIRYSIFKVFLVCSFFFPTRREAELDGVSMFSICAFVLMEPFWQLNPWGDESALQAVTGGST